MKLSKSLPILLISVIFVLSNVVCDDVLDSRGKILRPGVPYYILPADAGNGGGLVPYNLLENITQDSCPLDLIFQSARRSYIGIPVIFTPWNSKVGFVPLSTNLNIEFSSDFWMCPESKVWRAKFSAWHRGEVVTTGGTLRGADSWFKIEKHGDAYKLVYSPRSQSSSDADVGVLMFGETKRDLVLSNKPLAVKFHRASRPANPSDEMSMLRMFASN